MEGAAKTQAELALPNSGMPFTVLRPVAFMENFDGQQQWTAETGIIDSRAPDRYVYFILGIRRTGRSGGEAYSQTHRQIREKI